MLKGYGSPGVGTPGNVGDIYKDLDSGKLYRCIDVVTDGIKHQFVTIEAYNANTIYKWESLDVSLKRYFTILNSVGFSRFFANALNLKSTDVSKIVSFEDTSELTSTVQMFNGCNILSSVPLFDTSKVTNMSHMFDGCMELSSVPLFDTSNVTDTSYMFNGCTNLSSVPLFDTSKVTTMHSMFYRCTHLSSVPLFDTSNVTIMNSMFNSCTNLSSVPLFDTSKVTIISYMFSGCSNLSSIPSLDLRNLETAMSTFTGCTSLTECFFKNIKSSIAIGSGTSYGHLLTLESLLHLIGELLKNTSSKTLTVGTANLEKIAGIHVKLVDITDEMRAEDDLIDKKLPFVVCESTDEGAMTIEDYASEKKWVIK